MIQLTTEELKQKIDDGENFVLDLYATWCGPCKMMLNILESVSGTEAMKNYNIYKFDIDSDRDFVIENFSLRSVPTVKIFQEGKEVFSKVGVMSQTEITNQISILHS
jgi:thioredoxin 1